MTETRTPDTPEETAVLIRLIEAAKEFSAYATDHLAPDALDQIKRADLAGAIFSVNVRLTPPMAPLLAFRKNWT
jgi:hypothetical protein